MVRLSLSLVSSVWDSVLICLAGICSDHREDPQKQIRQFWTRALLWCKLSSRGSPCWIRQGVWVAVLHDVAHETWWTDKFPEQSSSLGCLCWNQAGSSTWESPGLIQWSSHAKESLKIQIAQKVIPMYVYIYTYYRDICNNIMYLIWAQSRDHAYTWRHRAELPPRDQQVFGQNPTRPNLPQCRQNKKTMAEDP